MRAAWLAAFAGMLAALAGGPGNALAAAPESVAVRAATHPGFGRLVFEWPAPVAVDSRQDGDRLTLRFPRPFKADLGAVPDVLGDYLAGLTRAEDGRAVVLRLAPGIAARLDVDDDRIVVVDLAPGAAAGDPVALRTGVHDGFRRIVLDWSRPIDFAAEADGRRLRIRFERAARIDAATIRTRCRALLDDASASAADGRSELRLALKEGVRAEVFKVEDRQVVVDLYEPGRAPPARAAPEPVPAIAPRTLPGDALPEPAAAPPEPAAAPPEAQAPPPAAQASPLALEIRAAGVAGGAALEFVWNRPVAAAFLVRAGYLWSVFAPLSAPADTLLPASLASPVPAWLGPGERVDAAAGLALRFPLRRALAAQVERAGNRWRVILGTTARPPAAVQVQRLPAPPRLRIDTGEPVRLVHVTDPEVGDQLGFWPLLAPGLGRPQPQQLVELELLATAQGLAWRAQTDQLRAEAIDGALELQGPEGLRLSPSTLAARRSGPATEVGRSSQADNPSPLAADAPAGPAVSAPAEVPQTQVPEAEVAQTEATHAELSQVKAAPVKAAAPPESSTAATASALPAEPDRAAAPAGRQPGPAATLPVAPSTAVPRPPLDLARFAPASRASLADQRILLEQKVLNATDADRPAARLELARFLLAHGLAAEALGMLGIMDRPADPPADGPPGLARQALTGAAQLLMGRRDEAATGLLAPALDADPEVALWRADLAAARSDWSRAGEELARSDRILDIYPEPLQLRLGLPAVRTAIETGNQDEATRLLGRLKALKLPPGERARVAFLEGLAQARRGAIDDADRIWAALEQGEDDRTRVEAGYARVQMLLDAGRLRPAEALARLAAARPRWRPHPQEIAMLDGLARLYLRTGDPEHALHTWQDVLTHFPGAPETERVAKAMHDAFVATLLPEDGVGVGALRAYALYQNFPQLVPAGDLGDRLKRRLAAGLAGLDLVKPAAALLDPLIDHLNGPAKAEAGAYLAELWLRQPDPAAALAALDRSQVQGELPQALDVQRRVLRARALAASDKPDAALALLADGTDLAQQRLRAEILWQQRDWSHLTGALEDLLRTRADPDGPLGDAEQELVIKLAVAYARQGDTRALEQLRARFGEAMRGRTGEPAFLMATLPPGPAGDLQDALALADQHLDRVRAYLDAVRSAR